MVGNIDDIVTLFLNIVQCTLYKKLQYRMVENKLIPSEAFYEIIHIYPLRFLDLTYLIYLTAPCFHYTIHSWYILKLKYT